MASLLIILFCLFFLGIYFLPVIIAKCRGVRHFGSIVVINLFLGMTFVGWVVAFAMACSDNFEE
ncbi:MAG: superinfection immunity protein [Alphaproteobacteria bacterium]|nr:superinfection immunity protein [Alphaproteobacteria bacterium]